MPPLWTFNTVVVRGAIRPRLTCDGLQLQPGITAVLGESGAGKSTFLNLLVGFARPDSGELCAALPMGADRLPLFWVPQNDGLWPHLNVVEHLDAVRRAEDETSEALLDRMELSGLEKRQIDELSVGERSRLAVARAVAADAWVTVLDEPLAHVDRARRGPLWRHVLARAASGNASVVFATHSPRMVLGHATRVILLREGRVLAEGCVEDLYWRPATRDIAEALGPVNWFEVGDAARWLPGAEEGRNYRPSELQLDVAEQGAPLRVEALHFSGETTTVELWHEPSGERRGFTLHTGSLPTVGCPVHLICRPSVNPEGASC
ncbi:MAG: ATP-binding cassette domain-containing protein [Lentisphaerae bacterium]|nr:ATP-binding cassette domain-containing protein [Lentisphaerota bacterium]